MIKSENPISVFWIVSASLAVPIIPFLVIGELPGQSWLSNTDDNASLFGMTGALLLSSDILLPIPSTIIGTMLGARLGFWGGLFWCWFGLVLGNFIGYCLGKMVTLRTGIAIPESPTLFILAVTRPIPVLAEAVAFAAGAGSIKIIPFLFISSFANGIFAAVLCANGAAFIPDSLLGPGLILPMLVPVVGWLIWRLKFNVVG